MKLRNAVSATLLAIATTGTLVACSSFNADSNGESQADRGTVQLPLTAYGTTGAQFRLTLANFAIAATDSSVSASTTLSSDLTPDATSVDATLAVGAYAVTLGAGWQMQKLDTTTSTWSAVTATLLTTETQSFSVAEQATSVVTYAFNVEGEVVTTSTGQVSVRMTVQDGTGGSTSTTAAAGGSSSTGGSTSTTSAGGSTSTTSTSAPLTNFSFFVTSYASMKQLSGSANGFGGDLRFGQTTGLAGADLICSTIAEMSMPGSSVKNWRAFLSTSTVNAISRIGLGPWYDRMGRLVALNTTGLVAVRPTGANTAIVNDLPNEYGVPNHNPDGTGSVDNQSVLTGSNATGTLYSAAGTCNDWTSTTAAGQPRVGAAWTTSTATANWMSFRDEGGCKAGVNLVESGGPSISVGTVGSGGGYGAIYCFATTP